MRSSVPSFSVRRSLSAWFITMSDVMDGVLRLEEWMIDDVTYLSH